jgi:hypothetical protein
VDNINVANVWVDLISIICSEREHVLVVAGNFAQYAGSDLCFEDVGHMGKEPANTCIPHWIDYRTVLVLCTGYALLTRAVEGLCSISDRDNPALQFRGSWHVTSFHLCAVNRRFDFSFCAQ